MGRLQPPQIDTFDNLQNAVVDLLWGTDPSQLNLLLLRHLHERRQGWITTTTGIHLEPAFLYAEALRSLRDHLPPDMRPHDLQLATSFRTGLHQYIQSQLATVEMLRRHQPHVPPMTLDDLVKIAQQIQNQLSFHPYNTVVPPTPGNTMVPPTPGNPHVPPPPPTPPTTTQPTATLTPTASNPFFFPAAQPQPIMPALHTAVPMPMHSTVPSHGAVADLYNAPSGGYLTPGSYLPSVPTITPPVAVHATTATGSTSQISTSTDQATDLFQQLGQKIEGSVTKLSDRFDAMGVELRGGLAQVNSTLVSSGPRYRPRSHSPTPDRPSQRTRFAGSPYPSPGRHDHYRSRYDRYGPGSRTPSPQPHYGGYGTRFCRPCHEAQVNFDHHPGRCWGPCPDCGLRGHRSGSMVCTKRLPEAQRYITQPTQQPDRAAPTSVAVNTVDLANLIRLAVRDGQENQTTASMTRQALQRTPPASPRH